MLGWVDVITSGTHGGLSLSLLGDFGLQFEPQKGMSTRELVDWCSYAERKGYGYAFRSDHFLPIPIGVADSAECWTSLGAVAASTKTIRFGPMVTPTSYRNPALLAKMARTANIFSEGRLVFGLGAGWYETEYLGYGYEFPDVTTRLDQFDEALRIIIPMTMGEAVSFKGKYFRAVVEPLPRIKVNFLIGGKHRRVIEAAAKYADEWNIYGSSLGKIQRCKKALDAASGGRTVKVSNTGEVIIAENRRSLIEYLGNWLKESGLSGDPEAEIEGLRQGGTFCGTPEEVVSQINERRDLGVDRFYLEVADMRTKAMADLLTETLKGI
jgi:alkanesulfonate monooxygenase SsuD/methylene tetrahydromethanopterin reductase-like flavin-dependent oxidoreductase (luciferase family)